MIKKLSSKFKKCKAHDRRKRAENHRKQALWFIREHALELKRDGKSTKRFCRREMTETERKEILTYISNADLAKISLKHYATLDVNQSFKNVNGVRTTLIDVSAAFQRVRNHSVTRSLINLGCVPHAHNLDNKLKGAVMLYLMEGVKASFSVYLVNAIVSMRCVEEASLCEMCGVKEATLSWPRCNHVFCEVCFWKVRSLTHSLSRTSYKPMTINRIG